MVSPSEIAALAARTDIRVVGIDSDSRGSIALLDPKALVLTIYYVPSWKKELNSGKSRSMLNRALLATYCKALFHNNRVDVVYTEEQWSRPDQDVATMFTFGCVYCAIEQAMVSAAVSADKDCKFELVHSKVWKHALGLDADKEKACALASKLFPLCTNAWKLVKNTSAAEAALIAFYGYVTEMKKRGLQVDMKALQQCRLHLMTPQRVEK